ncbi:MAG: deoxyribodipyrimidine photo-lyase [Candidatus Nanopelagicales bacterium]|nr:deoxyribodipyrimidine photo-lyase [Candidatus Nanopelagicales bacterium]
MPTVMWFRRDLRLRDNPALLAAVDQARQDGDGRVVPLFVVDPRLWDASGPVRQAALVQSLERLGASLDRSLLIRHGDPAVIVPEVVRASGASSVHIAQDFGPYGRVRDAAVAVALGATPLTATGSPYAVAPGRVTKADGTAYRVFSAFHRAWERHGWRAPAADVPADTAWWEAMPCEGRPAAPDLGGLVLAPAGEQAAWERWTAFRDHDLAAYATQRDRPDLGATSGLSQHLRWGEIHPRSLLADLGPDDEVFRKELCWREFYADVLMHAPESARRSLDERFDAMPWATGEAAETAFQAWASGTTGYPLVDAGMRQLLAEGWMHNRVRMVVASFLVKDLHLPWQRGARAFMRLLRDGDLASNAHGWQWTAGCGTDAAPFYRIFNPVAQGLRFDPDGDYVRRYVPELAHLEGAQVHEPWSATDGYAQGYPQRIVDHAVERQVALDAYQAIRRV